MYSDLTLRPFLILAFLEWCERFAVAPFLLVQIDQQVKVPAQYITEEVIVLNVSQEATKDLKITSDIIEFYARFSGVSHLIQIPIGNVVGCFSSEPLQQALQFNYVPLSDQDQQRTPASAEPTENKPDTTPDTPNKRSHLTVVKK
jgi:stringent starvation protein B